jgi:hypothetical protein
MITPQELRIGNIVNRINFGPHVITAIKHGEVRTDKGTLPIRAIEGIPLTEEWLLKFGFTQPLIQCWKLEISKDDDERMRSSIQISFAGCGYAQVCRSGINAKSAPVQYVHQLQNLYFALTGQELTPLVRN